MDTYGNATAYYYTTETNHYGANKATTGVPYVRGGNLKRIDYGLRDTGNGITGQTAPRQITFDTAERCDPAVDPKVNCADSAQMTTKNALSWPDVPVDQQCKQGETCNNHAPTFWTTRKLTTITTWYNTGTRPVKVDAYALNQTLPGVGSGDRELRLDSIVRTGFGPDGTSPDGKSITLPPVSFTSQLFDNRVLGHKNLPAMAHWRLTNIATETGSFINVAYSKAECTKDTVPAEPSTNDKMCYPVQWNPPYFPDVILDYFHKYVVTEVQVQDRNGISPTQVTSYSYLGKPAWHYDDNEIVKPTNRTYGQFRGYGQVEVRAGNTQNNTGGVADKRTLTKTTYFRGMDGDTMPNNGKRPAKVRDSFGTELPDNDLYADQAREVETFNGDGGPRLSTTLTEPTTVATTATRARSGMSPLHATITATGKTQSFTHLAAGGTKSTSTTNRYDTVGRLVASTSSGDGVPDLCTTTRYADNTVTWVRGKPKEVITSQEACPQGDPTPRLILSDVRTYYDTSNVLGEVTLGSASKTETATDNHNGTLTFAVMAQATVDKAGRPKSATDAAGNISTTTYTPEDGGILSQVVLTNPKQQTSTTVREPSRGNTVAEINVAEQRTDAIYDPLGRLIAVWKPGQTKDVDPASATFDYLVRLNGPLAVTTKTLVDYGKGTNYVTAVNLYDGLGQLRQTQTDVEAGGRAVKDTFYDSHGWARVSNNRYYTNGAASTTLVQVADSAVDDRTIVTYDGSGRAERSTAYKGLNATWETRTVYGGDRTTVLSPQGGVASTTVTDVRGKTVELHQYTTPPAVSGTGQVTGGAPQVTKYHYTPTGQQDSVTDVAGTTWTYRYDFLGRKTSQTDPDTGSSTTTYNLLNQVTSTTDARGKTLSYEYDALGRKTAVHDGPISGPKLTEWTWDTLQAGKLSSSVRHTDKGDYVSRVTSYDYMGLPREHRTIIPAGETGLAGMYETSYSFTSTGLPLSVQPAYKGGLPDEILNTEYNKFGQPTTLRGDFDYVSNTTYTPYGETSQFTLSSLDSSGWLTYAYDPQTRRLTGQNLSVRTADRQVSDLKYAYDPAGNPTKTTEIRGPVGSPTRTQCYQYDPLNRLSQAWTATDDCKNTPSPATVGGPKPYWMSWTFEPNGLRKQQTTHAVPGAPGGDSVTIYTYPAVGAKQPHTLTSTATTGPLAGSTGYTYDPSGNTLTRGLPSGNQALTWDQENRLATVTTPAGETSYTYDADGGQLIRRDLDKTTLYLPGQELVRDNKTGVVTGTRYYTHGGTTIALRVGSTGNPQYLLSDPHGTGQVTVNSVGFAVTRRDQDAYGNNLGDTQGGPWPDQRGFLGKPTSTATGLTDIGARKYDPVTGRFISADPLLDLTDPQQMQGYAYANSNPISLSDPTGLKPAGCEEDRLNCRTGEPLAPVVNDHGDGISSVYDPHTGNTYVNGVKLGPRAPTLNKLIPALKKAKKNRNFYRNKDGGDISPDDPTWRLRTIDMLVAACGEGESAFDVCSRDYLLNIVYRQANPDAPDEVSGTQAFAGLMAWGLANGPGGMGRVKSNGSTRTRGGSGGCSFLPGTQVLMADGTYRSIEELKAGDMVLATDPETGETAPEAVLAPLSSDGGKNLIKITIDTDGAAGDQIGTLTATDNHPFWASDLNKWVAAAELHIGSRLRTSSETQVQVTAIRSWTVQQRVHNLTVADLHTYYVLARDTPVLVHNSNRCTKIDDNHIVNNHTPEGMFTTDKSKTEWLPETSMESRKAIVYDVLDRGLVVKDTGNREGVVKEFTYEEPIGYKRDARRTPLYTMRVYYDPDEDFVRNAFPVVR
ncbi:polymorphic toxin-type HINT domain-containing protein [Actinosynnema sp. ALI-1.44]|uniref:polymorphic toxin-type HINT domain-containing protein n=1 Tax=Actinosynnema sp. ALI-1.44 TaxID=1933779 RepID=UPI001EDBB6D5|nr:polymorphic toxin-type HINT domain-containing protein [Actinosynnema sp. ALI-1.44]